MLNSTLGFVSPRAFFFSGIPLLSVRITVVFLVAGLTQEIKLFMFL